MQLDFQHGDKVWAAWYRVTDAPVVCDCCGYARPGADYTAILAEVTIETIDIYVRKDSTKAWYSVIYNGQEELGIEHVFRDYEAAKLKYDALVLAAMNLRTGESE